jgi:hypothetical protein
MVGEGLGVNVAVGVGGSGEGVVVGVVVAVAVPVGKAGKGVMVVVLVSRLVGTGVSVGGNLQACVTVLHARLASSKATKRIKMRFFMLNQIKFGIKRATLKTDR